MGDFAFYFRWGTDHILTWDAMDHILFVVALCIRYTLKEWKQVVVLITAFTIGHSLTLALTALGLLDFPSAWIEFFIPITIAITAVNDLLIRRQPKPRKLPVIYFFALFFGLIHGMAFAGQFMSLEGTEGLVKHLLAFNLGIEAAQLLVVLSVLLIPFVFGQLLPLIISKIVPGSNFNTLRARLSDPEFRKKARLIWVKTIALIILVFSLVWAIQRFPNIKNNKHETTSVFAGRRLLV